MKKIVFTADSTFDLPQEIIEKYDFKVVPSYVILGETEYDDYPDITCVELFDYYKKNGKLPKTAAATPEDYVNFFKKYIDENSVIVHFAKSSEMSSCYQNACIASKELESVYVVDTKNISTGSGMLAVLTAEQSFDDVDECIKFIENTRDKINGSFVIESLEFLQKGGRCTSLQLLGANLLRLRPEIIIKDGKMTLADRYRGNYEICLKKYIDTKLKKENIADTKYLFITNTVLDKEFKNRLIDYIKSKGIFENIIIGDAGSAVSCHCGPNTFGFFFLQK